jgi:hypothetical protein
MLYKKAIKPLSFAGNQKYLKALHLGSNLFGRPEFSIDIMRDLKKDTIKA